MTRHSSPAPPGSAGERTEQGTAAARMVEAVAARPGGDRALLTADGDVAVGELLAAVDDVAAALSGADERRIVAVRGFGGWHWIAALLAVWRAGGVFMPLVDEGAAHPAPHWTVDLDRWRAGSGPFVREHRAPAAADALPAEAAYLLPTSGSTGRPKWLLGNGAGLRNFVRWEIAYLDVGPADVVSQLTPVTFDPMLRDVLVPLLSGAGLALPADRSVAASGPRALDWLEDAGVTVTHVIPTVARLWCAAAAGARLAGLRAAMIAGEPLFGWDVERWRRAFGDGAALFNLYGPSETTLAKCVHPIDPQRQYSGPVPVGRPWDATGMIVVDARGEVCPPFEPGEVLLRSADASFGYAGDPALTASRFVENPFDATDPVRVFRTGDVGYVDHRGDLVLTGRMDRQHKVRGVRVDLDALEDAIRQCPAVAEAAVTLVRRPGAPAAIAAYVVAGEPLDAVKAWLRGRVAPVAWPLAWQALERLPTTASGKVDRGALPDPVAAAAPDAAPSDTVGALTRIWSEALPFAGPISASDTFIELEGQSIEGMHIVAAVEEELGCRISLAELYELQTITNLAAHVERHAAPDATPTPLSPVGAYRGGPVPLTGAQSRFWRWIERSGPGVPRFQFPFIAHVGGEPDLDRLHAAVVRAVRESDGHRLSFIAGDGEVLQEPLRTDGGVEVRRAQPRAGEDEAAAARREGLEYAREPFRFGEEPLLRARLYALRSGGAVLVLVSHVLGSDGRTRQLLLRRISDLYTETGSDPPPAAGFLDYAAFEQASRPSWAEHEDHWRATVGGLAPMDLPYRGAAPGAYALRTAERPLPARVAAAVRARAKADAVTVPSVLLGALFHALAAVCGVQRGHVLLSHARRYHPSLSAASGCFTDSLVLPFADAAGPFGPLVRRTHDDVSVALSRAVPSFEHIVALSDLDPCDPRAFPVIFAPQPNLAADLRLGDLPVTLLDAALPHWIWPLEVYPVIEGDELRVRINTSVELFGEALGHDLAGAMATAVETYAAGA